VTHEILIREIPMRSELSDHGEVRTVRLGATNCWDFGSSVIGRMGGVDAKTPEARNHEILMSQNIRSG
jgi:hypothetical protein